ncbi:hypothetical protein JCM10213_006414 [Rhodosporidiobolus nylandii]
MVLANPHKKLASRRYKHKHAAELLTDEDATLKAQIAEVEKRRKGSNADRYREDDEQQAKASGAAGESGGPAGAEGQGGGADDEVDEEEEARKAAEVAELEAFRERQREQLLQQPSRPEEEDDDDDVDHSFAHLRIGGTKGKSTARSPVPQDGEDEALKAMQDEARRTQAIRDLKDRFSGGARPLPSASSSSRPLNLPAKPGPIAAKGGQDFLDLLL